MNARCSSWSRQDLRRILARLSCLGGEGFLYGSCVTGLRSAHDIDLLFVLVEEHHERVYQEVAIVQETIPFPLHPTVVTPLQFATNPLIRRLSQLGERLW
jgi:nucleotidyltransferase-like protein